MFCFQLRLCYLKSFKKSKSRWWGLYRETTSSVPSPSETSSLNSEKVLWFPGRFSSQCMCRSLNLDSNRRLTSKRMAGWFSSWHFSSNHRNSLMYQRTDLGVGPTLLQQGGIVTINQTDRYPLMWCFCPQPSVRPKRQEKSRVWPSGWHAYDLRHYEKCGMWEFLLETEARWSLSRITPVKRALKTLDLLSANFFLCEICYTLLVHLWW